MMGEDTLFIRRMTESDIAAVHEIERLSIAPPWTRQGFVDGLRNENAHFYVAEAERSGDGAEQERQVVGYCGLYTAADEGEISNIAVHPQWRGMGIADQILQTVLTDARENGTTQIFLEVRESNVPAIQLYEKHGFAAQGIRKNFYRDPKEHAVVMCCAL